MVKVTRGTSDRAGIHIELRLSPKPVGCGVQRPRGDAESASGSRVTCKGPEAGSGGGRSPGPRAQQVHQKTVDRMAAETKE